MRLQAIIIVLILLLSTNVYSIHENEKQSLIGAVPISLEINVADKSLEINVADNLKTGKLIESQIKNDVELKLLQSGIKLDSESWNLLFIECQLLEYKKLNDLGAFYIGIEFLQVAILRRSKSDTLASTYHLKKFGIINISNAQMIRNKIKDLLDQFIIEYLEANPKK